MKKPIFQKLFGYADADIARKVKRSLYVSLGINIGYAGIKWLSGIVYGVLWLDAFAVYYLLLTLIRFLLLRFMRRYACRQDLITEYQRCRLCGILMLFMNSTLIGIVAAMIYSPGEPYHMFMIVILAAYTGYAVTVSIRDLIGFRKYCRPIIMAAKYIRLTAAMVSVLSLEGALLARYGEDERLRRWVIILTGVVVCFTVMSLSVYMIFYTTKALHKIKNGVRITAKRRIILTENGGMRMDKKSYDRLAKSKTPPSPTWKNCTFAFLVGGGICTIGQVVVTILMRAGIEQKTAFTLTSCIIIFLGALFTGLGLYDKLAKYAGAGTIVPISGFANSIVSPAMEFKSEGLILGVGAKMFIIAGPVIVHGVLASVVYGIIYWIMR